MDHDARARLAQIEERLEDFAASHREMHKALRTLKWGMLGLAALAGYSVKAIADALGVSLF